MCLSAHICRWRGHLVLRGETIQDIPQYLCHSSQLKVAISQPPALLGFSKRFCCRMIRAVLVCWDWRSHALIRRAWSTICKIGSRSFRCHRTSHNYYPTSQGKSRGGHTRGSFQNLWTIASFACWENHAKQLIKC